MSRLITCDNVSYLPGWTKSWINNLRSQTVSPFPRNSCVLFSSLALWIVFFFSRWLISRTWLVEPRKWAWSKHVGCVWFLPSQQFTGYIPFKFPQTANSRVINRAHSVPPRVISLHLLDKNRLYAGEEFMWEWSSFNLFIISFYLLINWIIFIPWYAVLHYFVLFSPSALALALLKSDWYKLSLGGS